MSDAGISSTTVRVQTTTRDALNAEAEESGVTVDSVIQKGLRAIRLERLRRQFEADARRAGADAEDRAEMAAIMRDVNGDA